MSNKDRNLNKILSEIAREEGYKYEEWSLGWIIRLSRGDTRQFVYGYNFDANPSAGAKIAGDKVASYQILSATGVPAVEHRLFLRPSLQEYVGDDGVWTPMTLAVKELGGFPVVVKPNSESSSGSGVLRAYTQRELEMYSDALFSISRGIALAPYLDITAEFRAVIVGGEIALLFEKKRTEDWRHNLSRGAVPVICDKSERGNICEIALRASSVLGLEFCAVDVVSVENQPLILEVNSGIMLETFSRFSDEHYEQVKNVYREATRQMLSG